MKKPEQVIDIVNNLHTYTDCSITEINSIISDIKDIIKTDKKYGIILGSLMGKLSNFKKLHLRTNKTKNNATKTTPKSLTDKKSYWIEVGIGFLKIGHIPGGKKSSFKSLYDENTDTVLTILSEKEGAVSIGENVKSHKMDWLWIKLRDGKRPSYKIKPEILNTFEIIKGKLNNSERIYIHCSAGLHRTGMITNALLVFLGYDSKTSLEIIRKSRPFTAQEVGKDRLAWGMQFNQHQVQTHGVRLHE